MRNAFIYTALLVTTSLIFYACDTTTAPADGFGEAPSIYRFDVSPLNVQFDPTLDGVKDTTLLINIEAEIQNLNDSLPVLTVTDRSTDEIILQRKLSANQNTQQYTYQFPISTRTTYFQKFRLNIYGVNGSGNFSYAVASLNIEGFSVEAPQILEVSNPDTVTKPSSDTDLYPFTAKVTDQEGQDTIEGVFVRIINPETGEVNNSPFQLYDDGSNGEDAIANDSLYTITFPVDPNSQAQTFDLLYYATDKGGLTSDTVKTQFIITN